MEHIRAPLIVWAIAATIIAAQTYAHALPCADRVAATPMAAGSTRAGTFLSECVAGIDGLDIAVIGDSNTGAALAGMWGYHNGICEALLAMGGVPYATPVYPTMLRNVAASTGGWRSWAYLPGATGGPLVDGALLGTSVPWSAWSCGSSLMRYGRSSPPTVDGWALLQTGSYSQSYDAVYLDVSHPINVPGQSLRLRVRFGEFSYGNGWFRGAAFGPDGLIATGPMQGTASPRPQSRAYEMTFPATGAELRAAWSGAGAEGPIAVCWHSLYRPIRGWCVTSHAYMAGSTPSQVSAAVRTAGTGYRAELLREHRERQRAAGGSGRMLLWIQFGINGTISQDGWRTSVSRIMQEYRDTWQSLGYPTEDLAAIAFVGVQRNAQDSTNGGSPLGPVRDSARAAGYALPGLTVVHMPALVSHEELVGPPTLYQQYPDVTVHLSGGSGTSTDGYSIVSRRIIDCAIAHAACTEDLNRDGSVDGIDLSILIGGWAGATWSVGADLTGDETVDGRDLGVIFGKWGPCE